VSQLSIAPLEALVARLQAQWGDEALRPLRALQPAAIPTIPSGYPALDAALGGGIPLGRLSEMGGRVTSGMTTLIYGLVASAQAEGRSALWIDLPATFDPLAASRCRVVLERLYLLRLDAPDETPNILREVLLTGGLKLIVLDGGSEALAVDELRRLVGIIQRAGAALVILRDLPPGARLVARSLTAVSLLIERRAWLRRGQAVIGCRSRVMLLRGAVTTARNVDLDIPFEVA